MNRQAKCFFSIIIPVYNTQQYLPACLESVLSQDFTDYEVIIVNDGSTDSSLSTCETYIDKFSNAQIINKKNGGLSSARNAGLEVATGKYVVFMDSDDYWSSSSTFSTMYRLISADDYDLLIHEESRLYGEDTFFHKENRKLLKVDRGDFGQHIESLTYKNLYLAGACDKVIKRSILLDNDLWFVDGRKSEDMEWCAALLPLIDDFVISDQNFYVYRQQREGSITSSYSQKHILDIYEMFQNGMDTAAGSKQPLKKSLLNFWSDYYLIMLAYSNYLDKTTRRKVMRELREHRYLLQYGYSIKTDKLVPVFNLVPFRFLPKFLRAASSGNKLYRRYLRRV